MIKDIIRRVTAGMLSTITMLSSTPLSCALDFGPIARAEEDNIASEIVINVGDTYNVADRGVHKAWFQQNHFEAGNGRGAALKRLPAWRRIDETGASQFL